MRVEDYLRRIGHKLNRRYPHLENALREHFKTLEPAEQRRVMDELNRLDCDIGNELSAAKRKGQRDAWAGKFR